MAAAHSGAAYAFVTLVTTDDYLPAALVAAHSLRLAHSHSSLFNIDLVALVTPATLSVQTIRVLLTVFDRVIGVEPLGNSDNLALLGRIDLGMSAGAALTKLHTWRLTDYQKIVYLDADVLVLKPLAHLFASPHAFAAAPDTGWPDIFNSGVMVLTPSEDTFAGLLELAANTGSWDGADQGLINEYFGGEVGSGSEGQGGGWTRLGFTYNTT
ncbi:nucleotide-diphospho-sugar transferase, partial [Microstroma glucosiphilum]